MRQIPMLFSHAMIEALLAGRKTETRRILKIKGYPGFFQFGPSDTPGYDWTFRRKDHVWEDFRSDELFKRLRVKAGDLIWVREAHYLTDDGESEFAVFAADPDAVAAHKSGVIATKERHGLSDDWAKPHLRLRPSIHMPKWASRLTLRVTSYGIERLHEITEAGAVAEGIERLKSGRGFYDPTMSKGAVHVGHYLPSACAAYSELWNSINGDGAWDLNPWVSVTKFEVIHQNISEVSA